VKSQDGDAILIEHFSEVDRVHDMQERRERNPKIMEAATKYRYATNASKFMMTVDVDKEENILEDSANEA